MEARDVDSRDGARAAAQFFRQRPAWRPLLEQARRTYERLGRLGGSIRVPATDEAACVALAGLLGRDPRAHRKRRGTPVRAPMVRVSLRTLDRALRASRFACGLPEALQAYFDEPLETRPERRARETAAWRAFVEEAEAWFPCDGSRRWWRYLTRGRGPGAQLLRRAWNRGSDARQNLREAVHRVARALGEVPVLARPTGDDTRQVEPLAIFAHRICGDPHAFDANTLAGRLLLHALRGVLPEGSRLDRGLDSPALIRSLLLEAAGLTTDDVSSTVVTFQLEAATLERGRLSTEGGMTGPADAGGEDDPVVAAARYTDTVLVWPVREVRRRRSFRAVAGRAYVVENPQVFQALVDRVARLPVPDLPTAGPPTLICTRGQLSLAAILLLDRFATDGEDGATLYYGGDFDVGGLEIAHSVVTRYGERVRLWHMTPDDYHEALRPGGRNAPAVPAFDGRQRRRLERLRDRGFLPELIDAMLATGRPAYQEGLVDRLFQDLVGA